MIQKNNSISAREEPRPRVASRPQMEGEDNWVSGLVYRGTGTNSFIVHIEHWVGFVEVNCSSMLMADEGPFRDRVKRITPTVSASLVPVSIKIGKYSLARREFTDCTLCYPRRDVDTILRATQLVDICKVQETSRSKRWCSQSVVHHPTTQQMF
jgi:hypothetical protein